MKKIFLASSKEALGKARYIGQILNKMENVEVDCWYDFRGFRAGDYTLEALEKAGREYSGGVFVFNEDDKLAEKKDGCIYLPRDNVLVELGIFCGNLGRKKIAICLVPGVHIPSDLSGLTRVSYDPGNEDRMKSDFRNWLNNVPDFYSLPQNNVYMSSRKDIHNQCTLDDRLHLSDGKYKYIKNMRLMNFACNLFLNPEMADIGELDSAGISPLSQSLNRIMEETNAQLELMLTDPTEYNLFDAETKIANQRAGSSANAIRSAIEAVSDMLSPEKSIYGKLYPNRFQFYLSKICLPFGIFNVEFMREYEQYNHVKVDLYSATLDNEDNRRSFIVWARNDSANYHFFIDNFNTMKRASSICWKPVPQELESLINSWKG